uniref:Uncharacterized protein n=1 Tax=Fagus sylvatica TaxID=28930 RepID=A0A2N9GKU1_FAGSY
MENLVPVRGNPPFHLGLNFRVFQQPPASPHSNGPASLSALSSLPPHSSKAADFPHISDQLASSSSLVVPCRQCAEYVSVSH